MRLWEKNFLITLALFALLLFACIFFITTASFSSALSSERDTALREEYILSLSLQQNIPAESADLQIPSVVSDYASYYRRKNIFLSLEKGGSLLYSNLPVYPENLKNGDDIRTCQIFTAGGIKYFLIQDTLGTGEDIYGLVYLKDITVIYESASRQTYILFLMGSAVFCVFAAALWFTLKRIYRPAGDLAHELRTPLTAIRGYAEYLQAAAASEEERYSASQYIIDESRRLSDICEKLLVMATLSKGDIPFTDVDIKSLFENAKMTYKNVEYDVKTQFIKGNKALLQSMINNLVSNALRASRTGAAVRLHSYDYIIEVSDSGKGMSVKTLSHIAKTGRSGRNVERNGNGLGIPLCYQIARLHDAKLNFESVPGKGTTVRITFTSQ
jgi:hypothetical protein